MSRTITEEEIKEKAFALSERYYEESKEAAGENITAYTCYSLGAIRTVAAILGVPYMEMKEEHAAWRKIRNARRLEERAIRAR